MKLRQCQKKHIKQVLENLHWRIQQPRTMCQCRLMDKSNAHQERHHPKSKGLIRMLVTEGRQTRASSQRVKLLCTTESTAHKALNMKGSPMLLPSSPSPKQSFCPVGEECRAYFQDTDGIFYWEEPGALVPEPLMGNR